MENYLITLSSPIAVKTVGGVKMINTVEATVQQVNGNELLLTVTKYLSNDIMLTASLPIAVRVKSSNIRAKQALGRTA